MAFDDAHNRIVGTLQAGSLALYRSQSKEEEPYAIEYYLGKGMI